MTPEERARAAVDDARFPPAGSNGYDRLVQHIASAIRDAEHAAAAREREAILAIEVAPSCGDAGCACALDALGAMAEQIRARGAR